MDWERTARLLAKCLQLIEVVVQRFTKRPRSQADALTVIGTLLSRVSSGDLEVLDLDRAEAELAHLESALRDNDDAADRAVDRKFGD